MTHSYHPAAWVPLLGGLTTEEAKESLGVGKTAILLPLGSVEPHGPHLPLATDLTISEVACLRAARRLAEQGIEVYIAPSVPYGVTDFAAGFAGAIGVPKNVLTAFLRSIVERLLADGWKHVCVVNNHLEPAQDEAVRAAIAGMDDGAASVACPLSKRWGRTLSDEFKKGNCHAGRYETSLALAAGARVLGDYASLPDIETSLSEGIKANKSTFAEMGLSRAYTGAPAKATKEEGEDLFDKLSEMIVTEVVENLEKRSTRT